MRRPPTKLQVSTFPFLAVLLCAMGALLLLLFIMDRRAKIASKHQVSEAVEKRKARTRAEEEARQKEWDKAQAVLRQSLLGQQGKLVDQTEGVKTDLAKAQDRLRFVHAQQASLQRKIDGEKAAIADLYVQIAGRQSDLKEASRKDSASKAALIDATKELADLEFAFQQLRALRERQKETYSVVPYRGQRGDGRLPIYVECVRQGIVFHPEKKLMASWEMSPASVREEIERRRPASKTDKDNGAYVLFLVRPDGIANYYKAQTALKGLDTDFGYELVDQLWVLDFSGRNYAGGGSAGGLAKDLPGKPISKEGSGSFFKGPTILQAPSEIGTGGPYAKGSAVMPKYPGYPSGGPSSPPVLGKGTDNYGPPVIRNGGGQSGTGRETSGSTRLPTGGGPEEDGSYGSGRGPTLNPPTSSSFGGTPSLLSKPGTGNGSGGQEESGPFGPGGKPRSLNPTAPSGFGGAPSFLPKMDQAAAAGKSPMPAATGSAKPTGEPGAPIGPRLGEDVSKKQKPAPIPVLGSKDFIIVVECRSDHAIVTPGSMRFTWTVANQRETDRALAEAVASLIARRQASVRAGDSPYRPQIRFRVPPDGLRIFYHAWPLLEPLRVPMERENVSD